MSEDTDLDAVLDKFGVTRASPSVRSLTDPHLSYAFIEIKRNEKNLQVPSNAMLNEIRSYLFAINRQVDFILIDSLTKDAEAGIRATLLHHLGDKIRNCFMSIEGRSAEVWIVPKTTLTPEDVKTADKKINIFLENIGVSLKSINSTSEVNTPTKSACLSILRAEAPASLDRLVASARDRDFVVPSEDWMSRMLDNLRKAGLVVRFKNGLYALTLAGLKAGGTEKNARSPDVRRVLALARGPR